MSNKVEFRYVCNGLGYRVGVVGVIGETTTLVEGIYPDEGYIASVALRCDKCGNFCCMDANQKCVCNQMG